MATEKQPSSSRAMADALSVPELLESILLHVDMATLLVSASRVNKHWMRTIRSSPKLQQKLFFRPGPTSEEHASDSRTPVTNPLLAKMFGKCFFDTEGTRGLYHRSSSFQDLAWSGGRIKLIPLDRSRPGTANIDEGSVAAASRRRFTRSGASWRRMLVSQPPPPLAGYLWMDRKFYSTAISAALVGPEPQVGEGTGICMGQLYDMVQSRAAHPSPSSVWSVWFRVTWHRPREPTILDFCHETCGELLLQTSLVVEFYHIHDHSYLPDPVNTDLFHRAFRCDDFRPLEINADLLRRSETDSTMLDRSAVVYDPEWYPWRFAGMLE